MDLESGGSLTEFCLVVKMVIKKLLMLHLDMMGKELSLIQRRRKRLGEVQLLVIE